MFSSASGVGWAAGQSLPAQAEQCQSHAGLWRPSVRPPETCPLPEHLYQARLRFGLEQLIFMGNLLMYPLLAMGICHLPGRGGGCLSHQGSLRFEHRGENSGPASRRGQQHLALSAGELLDSPEVTSHLSMVETKYNLL